MNIPTFLNDWPSRKAWFALVLMLAGCAHSPQPVFQADAGLQLYSVRAQMAKDVPGTLAEVHSWGIKYLEGGGTYGRSPDQFKALLASNGLQEVSGQFNFAEWKSNPEGTALRAQEMGWTYAGTSWIPHIKEFKEADCRNAIEVFNRAGEAAARHHVQFFYHPHGYEFQPYGNGTLFDLLMRETNPQYVSYQMDIFWIVHPGQDPVKLLKKYAGRWKLMHLKDMRKGTPTGLLTGSSPVTNDVAMGTGIIDIPAILRTAREVGVQWYFIEDESPASEQQIPQSLAYLRKLSQ